MTSDTSQLVALLREMAQGKEVSLEKVKAVQWSASGKLDKLASRIWAEMQRFCFDDDIRAKDAEYDKNLKARLAWHADELEKATAESLKEN